MTRKKANGKRRAWGNVLRRKRPAAQRATHGEHFDGWYVRFPDASGRRIMEKVPTPDGKSVEDVSRADAEAYLAQRRGEIEHESSAGYLPDACVEDYFVEHFSPVYRPTVSAEHYNVVLGHIAAAVTHFGALPMRKIDRTMMRRFFADLSKGKRLPQTVGRYRATLGRLWGNAVEDGFADANPLDGVTIARAQERDVPYIPNDALLRLYAAMPSDVRPWVVLLGEAGLRLSEAERLQWSDVSHDFDLLTIHTTKSGKVRQVPLTPRLREVLRQLHAARPARPLDGSVADYVLPRPPAACRKSANRTPGEPPLRVREYLRARFRPAAKKAGIEGVQLRDLRHAFATALVRLAVPFHDVASLLGHSDGGVLVAARYGRHAPGDAGRRAMDLLGAAREQEKPKKAKKAARPPRAG